MAKITEAQHQEKAVFVGVIKQNDDERQIMEYLDELEFLAETAGAIGVKKFIQKVDRPDSRTYIRSGKLQEIKEYCEENEIEVVIFDDELSPTQLRNIERELDIRILDRTNLILDIFAQRAKTAYAKMQVELAQYQYLLPRLTRMWTHLERQKGGIGMRGPGETQIETDRRIIQDKISRLKEQLKKVDKQMASQRGNRGSMVRISLVGYTNVGKSTLMNLLAKSDVFAENKLFATLDPTTRKYTLPCGESILLTDTVGFINKLPHHLVSAFHSTLEEAAMADILLIIIDASDTRFAEQLRVTEELLVELGAGGKPTLYVFNKCDRGFAELREIGKSAEDENIVYISALTGQGMDSLISKLEAIVTDGKRRVTYFIPNAEAGALNTLYRVATVEDVQYGADGITAVALADAKARGMMKKYATDDIPDTSEDWEE